MLVDDELSTLEAALAFVDAHYPVDVHADGDTDLNASEKGVALGAASLRTAPLLPPPSSPSITKAAAKRARDIQAAARSNRKKRAELLQLRALAAVLETRRDTLLVHSNDHRRRRDVAAATNTARLVRATSASEAATVAAWQLNESRALNRRLCAALEQQRRVAVALAHAVKKRLDLKCVQDLLKEMRVHEAGLCVGADAAAATLPSMSTRLDVVATLANGRCALSQDLPARLRAFSAEASVGLAAATRDGVLTESYTRVVRPPGCGPVIEMVAAALIPCSLDDGWEHVTGVLSASLPSAKPQAFSCTCQLRLGCGVSERDYSMELPSARVAVDGITLLEVFEPADMKLRYELHTAPDESPRASKGQLLAESLLHKARQNRSNLESAMAARFGSDVSCAALLLQ